MAAIVGAVIYAALVGTISSFSLGLDSSGRKYKEKLDEVNEYMTFRKLSEPIKTKVRQYYELKYRGKYFNEDAILSEMNESLKQVFNQISFCLLSQESLPISNINRKSQFITARIS